MSRKTIHLLLTLTLLACQPAKDDQSRILGRSLVGQISNEDLLNLDPMRFEKLDSITAFKLCIEYPFIHDWDNQLFYLRQLMPDEYLKDNIEYEKEKSAKDFLKSNYIYTYSENFGDASLKGYLTRSTSDPSEWREKLFRSKLFLTSISTNKFDPVLIWEYMHFIPIVEIEWHSITRIYSDNSIEFVSGEYVCSDVIIDGMNFCDSIRITTNYWIDYKTSKLIMQSDTVRLEYGSK